MRLSPALSALLCLALAGCADFPALDGTISPAVAAAPAPDLVPLGPLLARAAASDSGASQAETGLTARITALQSRADRLRGPVIPPRTRTRMLRGVR